MAYWGITMSLAGRNHEFYRQRKAAIERMVILLGANKGVPLEQGYAYAAAQLITGGVRSSGEAFQAIARQFPNDVQSRLLGNFLTRDGFDGNGEPRIGQQRASESLKKMVAENPDNLSVISFWVTSQSESPLKGEKLRADVLPYARKLVEKQPESPIFHLVLTHVEAKCGNAALALAACQKAIDFYENYMKAEGVSRYDCDGWIRAKIYQANLYTVLGHYEKSLPVTEELASLKVDPERIFFPGSESIDVGRPDDGSEADDGTFLQEGMECRAKAIGSLIR
jgi:tetratricopeptide (TPR) repeat protein